MVKMKNETRHVIAYFRQYSEFIEAIRKIPKVPDKIRYMKLNLDLDDDTELTQVQVNLFYAALGHIEWEIVLQEIGGWN